MGKWREKINVVYVKGKNTLKNKSGAILGDSGKMVLTALGLTFLLGITVYLFGWSKGKVEDTTKQIDTEYSNWSN